ncbi:amino acid permease-domain-containing protein [Kockovaella imperatae]|uniref:Amino acid permease-domain-containing protein n=1 Tax=Kockovaella imperatae TaxID=4999 RepID=A0A1Y1UE35_9TREE|nr:amino acid permease-domain-containing protein [Kockovaella imperatae]ORX36310.1 amino acid permease-domain-containing protein [Kockovaella imperatae]
MSTAHPHHPDGLNTRWLMTASPPDMSPPSSPIQGMGSGSGAGPSNPRKFSRRPSLSRYREHADGAEHLNSFVSSTSSVDMSNAPTPWNTFSPPDAYETVTMKSQGPEEMLFDQDPDVSFQLSLTGASSNLSTHPSFRSSHKLLPSASPSRAIQSPIPSSRKSVPNPPLSLRSGGRSLSDFPTPLSEITRLSPSTPATQFSDPIGAKSVPDSDILSSSVPRSTSIDVDTIRLRQLGYDSVLGRDYTFWSSLCISTINIGSLQGALYAVSGAYNYGGPLMILVAWPISGIFGLCLTLTMSELASAYPVSGAMASWAWKAARGGVGHERAWGWLMGGVVLGGHIGNAILVLWEISRIITGTMEVAFNYEERNWQSLLFFLAVLAVCGVTGATAWGRSHRFWLAAGAYFVAVWLILNATLIAGVVRNPYRGVSTHFWNSSGWSSRGYVGLLGWQYCTLASGMDASAHMAEETRNPSRNVPNAMTGSIVVTYIMGYISILLLLLAVDPKDAFDISTHSFPAGHILQRAVSTSGSIAISCLLVFVLTMQVLAQLQASSRFVFSLARDNAMPFSKAIQWTNSSKQPVVAHFVVIALCAPFAALTLAGSGTLYSILAVTAGSLSFLAYVVPVGLYLVSKKDLQTEGRTSWSLRGFSKPIGCIGVAYGCTIIVVQMLPGHRPVTAGNMSWSSVILVGACLISFITWKLYGAKHYSGPIRALTKWETGMEIDLQSALASSRSRSGAVTTNDHTGRSRRRPSESSIKMHDLNGSEEVIHTITVASARTMDLEDTNEQWGHDRSTGWTENDNRDDSTNGRV